MYKIFLYFQFVFSKCIQLTPNQVTLYKNLLNTEKYINIVTGPAGSGKTHIAIKSALECFNDNEYKRIVIFKSLINVDSEEIGFLPGDVDDKTLPYFELFSNFFEYENVGKDKLNSMKKSEQIVFQPISFIRGKTFDDCFIIVDEAQNLSELQMKTLLTRIGMRSKIVICGDLKQKDDASLSGLDDLIHKIETFRKHEEIDEISVNMLTNEDIKRSTVCQLIHSIYEKTS